MTAPMRSVPAMPPAPEWMRHYASREPGLPTAVGDAVRAYCYAQTAADRDGQRRRVFKDGDVWRIEPVPSINRSRFPETEGQDP